MQFCIQLTVRLSLPDGVAQSKASGDHVEHGRVVGGRRPPGERQQQSAVERRAGNDDINAPDVRGSHVTNCQRRDSADSSVSDDDESDAMHSQRTVYVGL